MPAPSGSAGCSRTEEHKQRTGFSTCRTNQSEVGEVLGKRSAFFHSRFLDLLKLRSIWGTLVTTPKLLLHRGFGIVLSHRVGRDTVGEFKRIVIRVHQISD
jgi:hypothetical protein